MRETDFPSSLFAFEALLLEAEIRHERSRVPPGFPGTLALHLVRLSEAYRSSWRRGIAKEISQIRQHSRDKLSPFGVNFCFPAGLRCDPAGFGNAAVWLIDECFVDDCICALLVPSLASSAPSPSHLQPTLQGLNGFIHRTIT